MSKISTGVFDPLKPKQQVSLVTRWIYDYTTTIETTMPLIKMVKAIDEVYWSADQAVLCWCVAEAIESIKGVTVNGHNSRLCPERHLYDKIIATCGEGHLIQVVQEHPFPVHGDQEVEVSVVGNDLIITTYKDTSFTNF